MAVFGIIINIYGNEGTAAFIALLVLLVLLEYFIKRLGFIAYRYGYRDIFEKLKKELMILGIISFSVFIYESTTTNSRSSWFYAFEMAHITMLFMALSFITQAIVLIRYATVEGRHILKAVRTNSIDLLRKFKLLSKSKDSFIGNLRYLSFIHFPSWLPFYPTFRHYIEYKIIERAFLNAHKLPREFKFAKYANSLYKTYISELGDISSLSWITLACIVLLNFIRLKFVDPNLVDESCRHHSGHEIKEACLEYTLRYAFICACALSLVIIIINYISGHYMDKLIELCLNNDELSSETNSSIRQLYKDSLKLMHNTEKSSIDKTNHSILELLENEGFHYQDIDFIPDIHRDSIDNDVIIRPTETSAKLQQRKMSSAGHLSYSLQDYYNEKENEENYIEHSLEITRHLPFYQRYFIYLSHLYQRIALCCVDKKYHETNRDSVYGSRDSVNSVPGSPKSPNRSPNSNNKSNYHKLFKYNKKYNKYKFIFVFSSSSLYFKVVEFILLFQCFYISLWATQLIPLAIHSYYKRLWIASLTLPILLNLFLIGMILHRSVMLKTLSKLNSDIVGTVCEECILEKSSILDLQTKIHNILDNLSIEKKFYKRFIYDLFDLFDVNRSGTLDIIEFRNFLGYLDIYMSKSKFDILWDAIDLDLSGAISADEIFIMMFPEFKLYIKDEITIIENLRLSIKQLLNYNKVNKYYYKIFLFNKFKQFSSYVLPEELNTNPSMNSLSSLTINQNSNRDSLAIDMNISVTNMPSDSKILSNDNINFNVILDKVEFYNFLKDCGIVLNKKEYQILYLAIDINTNGYVEYNEFYKIAVDSNTVNRSSIRDSIAKINFPVIPFINQNTPKTYNDHDAKTNSDTIELTRVNSSIEMSKLPSAYNNNNHSVDDSINYIKATRGLSDIHIVTNKSRLSNDLVSPHSTLNRNLSHRLSYDVTRDKPIEFKRFSLPSDLT